MLRLLFECDECKSRYEMDADNLVECGTPICTDCNDQDCSCLGYSTDPDLHIWKDLDGDLLEHKSEFARDESLVEPWFTELKEVEDRYRLIVLAWTKNDVNGSDVFDDEDGNSVKPDLTDDEWNTLRRRFDKGADHLRSDAWDLLLDLANDIVAERPEKGDAGESTGAEKG